MRRSRVVLFAGLVALALAVRAEPNSNSVRVFIPPEMDVENLRIGEGIYGQGLQAGDLPGEPGVYEYVIPCATSETVRLFAYLPGYRIDHVDGLRTGDSWSPAFEPLSSVSLAGRFVDTQDRPLPGETLVFSYFMDEAASFFGYSDGGVPRLPVATARTRADGTFQVSIPRMAEDPFFANPPYPEPRRHLDVALAPRQDRQDSPWTLNPARIPLQSEYAAPIVIQRVGMASLGGTLTAEFLRKNGVTGRARNGPWPEEETGYRLELRANIGNSCYNCNLQSNLAFSVILPPGRYDLQLVEMKRGQLLHQTVPVNTGLVLEENADVDLLVE